MDAAAPCPDRRHGGLAEFLALTDGLTISKITEVLRCCAHSVRNWIKGRPPIPWHRIEVLRIWRATVCDPAPHFLSRRNAFEYYVRGWNVADKVRHAKANRTFCDVLRCWRAIAVERVREWRSGPLFPNPKKDFPPPA
ncbi:IS21 family transposase [Burkholderia dolosa]|uniref:IS21 family transposase n=1 Tax=Burkholderia dolosa TaxID=152500 RepID=UPI001B9E0415|nr:IS21 family transposase [Burkholderia dolosa]MBR8317029.1 IS21 family transposase [Burkholderia dolosa]